MAVLQITQLSALDPATVDDTIRQITDAIQQQLGSQPFAISTRIQQPNAIQIISESNGEQKVTTSEKIAGLSVHVILDRPAFGVDGPATAHVVEFVQVWFAASRVTPAFQKQIEDDIRRFDEIFKKESKGDIGLAIGWGAEEQCHETIKDGKAKCFFLLRGWESMEWFEKSIQTESYREAVPILYAWKAPTKLWHVENKVKSGPGLGESS